MCKQLVFEDNAVIQCSQREQATINIYFMAACHIKAKTTQRKTNRKARILLYVREESLNKSNFDSS